MVTLPDPTWSHNLYGDPGQSAFVLQNGLHTPLTHDVPIWHCPLAVQLL